LTRFIGIDGSPGALSLSFCSPTEASIYTSSVSSAVSTAATDTALDIVLDIATRRGRRLWLDVFVDSDERTAEQPEDPDPTIGSISVLDENNLEELRVFFFNSTSIAVSFLDPMS
jgi:hypothetical protein